MKILSLELSKKLAALGIECESDYWWCVDKQNPKLYVESVVHIGRLIEEEVEGDDVSGGFTHKRVCRAYQLHELVPVLKAIGENGSDGADDWKIHWLAVCSLYAQTESLDGEVEAYVMELLK